MDLRLGGWKFKHRHHDLKYIIIDESVNSIATLEPLVFIKIICITFYFSLLDYKQLKDKIRVSVIFEPKGVGPDPYTVDIY